MRVSMLAPLRACVYDLCMHVSMLWVHVCLHARAYMCRSFVHVHVPLHMCVCKEHMSGFLCHSHVQRLLCLAQAALVHRAASFGQASASAPARSRGEGQAGSFGGALNSAYLTSTAQ